MTRQMSLQWTFDTESKSNEISGAYSNHGYSIDCWPPSFWEVRYNGESVQKCGTLHEAIQVAETDYQQTYLEGLDETDY